MIKRMMHIPVFAAALVLLPALAANTATVPDSMNGMDGLTVVELFTSQGCNSCPPADALASELADRPGVLVLSWNVDYWDYLGWKDTLARPENTARQRAYNRALGRGNRVFTPQMVIGGRDQAVGSDRLDVETAIAENTNRTKTVPVHYDPDFVTVDLPEQARVSGATISIIHYEFAKTIPIRGGENGGKAITYSHVVMESDPVATWDGDPTTLKIAREKFCDRGNAIIVQQANAGPILLAAVVDISL
jgi:hypothetical protein